MGMVVITDGEPNPMSTSGPVRQRDKDTIPTSKTNPRMDHLEAEKGAKVDHPSNKVCVQDPAQADDDTSSDQEEYRLGEIWGVPRIRPTDVARYRIVGKLESELIGTSTFEGESKT